MDKIKEREIVIKRFFWGDRTIYRIGTLAKIDWFDKFDRKFARDTYAYFSTEEKKEAIEKITRSISDNKFIEILNGLELPGYMEIDRFIGEHYFFEKGIGFSLSDKRNALKNEVKKALEETKEMGYFFLKAIIELHKEEKWDKAYGGATWVDILAKIRELGGKYPSPRHLAILKSYKIYYKTGSRRYPTHTIPEEMIPTIESELERSKPTQN